MIARRRKEAALKTTAYNERQRTKRIKDDIIKKTITCRGKDFGGDKK